MKRLFSILILFAVLAPAFCGDFSEYENSLLQEIFQKRLESRKFNTNAESLAFIKNYHNSIRQAEIQTNISDEAKITFENLLIWEEFHYMWEQNPNDINAWNFIKQQYQQIIKWNESHPESQRNNWYSISAYDLISSYMPKLKMGETMKIGLEQKRFYDSLIEKKSNSSIVYMNAALWYDFAPGIGGGSRSKARKYFEIAIQKANTNYEKFYAYLYLSQFEFDDKKKDACGRYLAIAESVLPGSGYIKFVKKMNGIGYSYLEYTKNREKVEKKLR